MKLLLVFVVSFVSAVSYAGRTQYVCLAQGSHVGGNDLGQMLADARLMLTLRKDKKRVYHLRAEGVIMVTHPSDSITRPNQLNAANSYMGLFNTVSLKQDLNYKPVKYVDHIRFKDFEAQSTAGLGKGMSGYIVVPKRRPKGDSFPVAYIFEAGDSMGGTLHFKCDPARNHF